MFGTLKWSIWEPADGFFPAWLWDDGSVWLTGFSIRTEKGKLDQRVAYAHNLVVETTWECLGGPPTQATKPSLPLCSSPESVPSRG